MAKSLSPEKIKSFLARYGAPTDNAAVNSAVGALLTDLHKHRDRLRNGGDTPYKPDARIVELEGENTRLEGELDRLGALVPAQGAVVLSAEDAKVFDAYKALGKPEELKTQLTELPKLQTKVAETERTTGAREAAKLLGWNEEATIAAIGDKQLVVSLVDGKDAKNVAVKIPHVRPAADDKAAPIPLKEWVEKNAAYLTPALAAAKSGTGGTTSTGATGAAGSSSTATSFPAQSGGGTAASTGDPVADFGKRSQDARNTRPSPFAPRTVAVTT